MTRILRQQGFTLMEALVAVAILSIAATAAIEVFAAGARSASGRAERYRLFHDAEMRLSLLRAEVLASGDSISRETTIDGYQILERAEAAATIEAAAPPALFEISVVISTTQAPERTIVDLTDFVVRARR